MCLLCVGLGPCPSLLNGYPLASACLETPNYMSVELLPARMNIRPTLKQDSPSSRMMQLKGPQITAWLCAELIVMVTGCKFSTYLAASSATAQLSQSPRGSCTQQAVMTVTQHAGDPLQGMHRVLVCAAA
jgi:hypothetical protein